MSDQIFRLHAKHRSDLREQLKARVVRGVFDGRRKRGSRGAAAGSVGLPVRAVADPGLDRIERQSQLFGDDGARIGSRSRAEILRSDLDRDGPVRLDKDIDLALRTPAAAPGRAAAAHAALERLYKDRTLRLRPELSAACPI